MPAVVEINKLDSNKLPKSNNVKFIQEWRRDWIYLVSLMRLLSH